MREDPTKLMPWHQNGKGRYPIRLDKILSTVNKWIQPRTWIERVANHINRRGDEQEADEAREGGRRGRIGWGALGEAGEEEEGREKEEAREAEEGAGREEEEDAGEG